MTTVPTETTSEAIPPGPRRWVLTVLSVMLLLTFLGVALAYIFGYQAAKYFIESPAGALEASRGLSKAIKVDGEFAPLHLDHWKLETDSFTSTGWPGEAIGGLNLYGIHGEFDPNAVWRGVYHIKSMQVDRAQITLLKPNDALKRPPIPKKPKPWYAHFLPSVFEMGPITTPHADLDFEFQNQVAHVRDAQMQADLIGRDFRYTATSGTMEFPYLPPLHIQKLVMMVTRPMITIESAELAAIDPADPAHLSLQGSLGQREDKTVDAIVKINQMPIEQALPEAIAAMVHGRATGHLTWKRDKSGQDVFSEGEVDVSGASIADLAVFKQLAVLHGNPDLVNFTFDKLNVKFHMHNGHFTADLIAEALGKFTLTGTVTYEQATKEASITANVNNLPLRTWLPSEFKPRYSGVATASLQWKGQLSTIKDSSGTVSINLDGTHIHNPVLLQRMLAKTKLRTPDEIDFKTAQLDFAYEGEAFQLTRAQLDLPGILTAQANGKLASPDNTLDAILNWQGLTLGNWLPRETARQISGDLNGGIKVHVQKWKLKDGSYAGDIELVRGQLRYTSFQSTLARFVGDKRLLEIPLTRASFSFAWNNGALTVSKIDLRGADDIGVQGDLALSPSGKLSGLLWIGTRPKNLESFMGLGDDVFARNAEGLRWARVKLSGTAKEPKQDLSTQLSAQLGKHPTAIFGLSGKLASWYVGNLFGAGDEWKRP